MVMELKFEFSLLKSLCLRFLWILSRESRAKVSDGGYPGAQHMQQRPSPGRRIEPELEELCPKVLAVEMEADKERQFSRETFRRAAAGGQKK